MVRKFHTLMTKDENEIARWLNRMNEMPDDAQFKADTGSRHVSVHGVTSTAVGSEVWVTIVISRLEAWDE